MSCPNCNKKPVSKYAPFCSKKCSLVDLHKWLNNQYVAKGESLETIIYKEPSNDS